ncbi:MAG: hypothetical protein H3C38_07245 [Rhodospirillales bacterium]|nr:hypothetical protein [Rhodospirillales bacterium]
MLLGHYFELFRQERGLVVAIAAGVFAVSVVIAVARLFLMPGYTATAIVTVLPTPAELSYSRRFVSDGDGGSDPSAVMMQTHIEHLLSRPVAELTYERLLETAPPEEGPKAPRPPLVELAKSILTGVRAGYQFVNTGTLAQPSPRDKAILGIQKAISVDWVHGSYILRISADADSAAQAARIANSVAQAYVTRSRQLADQAATAVRGYLQEEIAKRQMGLDPDGVSELRRRLVDIELSRTAGLGQVRIIEPAKEPLRPAFRAVPAVVGGAVGGVLIAVLVIVLKDTFGATARTGTDMMRIVGRRFLGSVPPALAQSARRLPVRRSLPLPPVNRFAALVAGRIALLNGHSDQLWVHVIGIGGRLTARQGGIAIATALANWNLPAELVMGPDERYRVRHGNGGLQLDPVAPDDPVGGGPVVTAGPPSPPRPLLLIDARESRPEAVEQHTQVFEVVAGGVTPRPIVVIAVAAGEVEEDLLSTMAADGAPDERLFLLVS